MAWKNASDGKETGMDLRPNAYSRRPGCVKRDLATAGPESLGSGLERQGCFGELGRGVRESEEARGLAQHRGVDEEAPVPALGHDHHSPAAPARDRKSTRLNSSH